ncbi:MAG: hypothetical protein VX100_22030 [Pseudomonadota bacterium]|nr:hypothetical protein [Pseudomonadota bacterium]
MLRLLGHTSSAAIKARSKRTKIEQQRSTDPSIGERLEQSQNTLISTAIGIALQRKAYEVRNDQSEIAFLNEKTQNFQKLLTQSSLATQLMWQSEQLFKNYIRVIKNSNEVDATRYLVEQAITLSNEPDFDPCVSSW